MAEQEAEQAKDWKPPYVSFQTVMGLIDRLAKGPIPPRIDKGYLDNYSGGVIASLLATLRTLGLIEEDGRVRDELKDMVARPEARKVHVLRLLGELYPEQLELAKENATSQQLEESFRKSGLQGSTLRKAIVFYLDAVKFAEAPNSPHFKAPRQSSGAARKGKGKPADTGNGERQNDSPPPATGDTYTVNLPGGGSVTLTVAASHFALSKNRSDREFVYGLVDAMTAYAEQSDQEVRMGRNTGGQEVDGDAAEQEVTP
jgi:hypothetical protein